MTPRPVHLSAALCLLLAPHAGAARGQTPPPASGQRPAPSAPAEQQTVQSRRASAVALVNGLADEARDFRDHALRARVQAQAADLIWDSDPVRARALLRRAWDAARAAARDAAQRRDEEPGPRARAGRGASAADVSKLRGEVLRLAGRRDRALAEEFFRSFEAAGEDGVPDAEAPGGRPRTQPAAHTSRNTAEAEQHRFNLAAELLYAGDTEGALRTATPALRRVTTEGLEFMQLLAARAPAEADKLYAAFLAQAAADPSADANTVSLLSSYLITPGLFVHVMANGGTMMRTGNAAPPRAADPRLRAAFFQTALQIFLRPLPPPDEDHTTAGRLGTYAIASRLLPLFEQHAPEHAALLSARIASLRQELPEERQRVREEILTYGLRPPPPSASPGGAAEGDASRAPRTYATPRAEAQEETADEMLARIGGASLRSASAEARDQLYTTAATQLAQRGDTRARELADRVADSGLRRSLREYVDFDLALGAAARGDAAAAVELARTGELSPVRRVYVLTSAAERLRRADPARAVALLEEAGAEARRVEPGDPERALGLTAVATRLFALDRPRAWTVLGELVRAANSADDFRGHDGGFQVELRTAYSTTSNWHGAPAFDLEGLFAALAAEDYQRAAEFARSFQNESPRATATLAIARVLLR